MFKISIYIFLLVASVESAQSETFADYHAVATHQHETDELIVSETIVQIGSNQLNRFSMHHVVAKRYQHNPKQIVFLSPGLFADFSTLELQNGSDYSTSLVANLAYRGIEVWGISRRATYLNDQNLCYSDPNCPVRSWSFNTDIMDSSYILEQIAQSHPRRKPFVGGHSMGAMQAIAMVNNSPDSFAGLILLDAFLFTRNTELQRLNQLNCEYYRVFSSQVFAEKFPVGYDQVKIAYDLGDRAFVGLVTADYPAIFGVPHFKLNNGDVLLDRLYFSSDERVLQLYRGLGFETTGNARDFYCSAAGDRTFTGQLDRFQGSLFVVRAGHGYGPYMDDTLSLFTSASSVFELSVPSGAQYGHFDFLTSAGIDDLIAKPMFQWLVGQKINIGSDSQN
jgi:pimeloyl-ACP methyl ester carboxylesterase